MTPFTTKFDWVRAISTWNSGLNSTQHHVALMLAEKMSKDGKCHVTHATLAAAIRMSERTVCSALTALADLEWIERIPGRSGRATDYSISRPAWWVPTEAPEKPTTSKRRKADPADVEAARSFLLSVYAATGIDGKRVDDDTQTTRRLLGVIRRHLTHLASTRSDQDKVREVLVESSLTSATDPAAVLLNRYKRALRLYPQHRPAKVLEGNPLVNELAEKLAKTMSEPRNKPPHQ